MYTPVHNLVSQRFVNALGYLIVNPGIGRHFHTTSAACPILCGNQECTRYSTQPVALSDVPPFDKPYGS